MLILGFKPDKASADGQLLFDSLCRQFGESPPDAEGKVKLLVFDQTTDYRLTVKIKSSISIENRMRKFGLAPGELDLKYWTGKLGPVWNRADWGMYRGLIPTDDYIVEQVRLYGDRFQKLSELYRWEVPTLVLREITWKQLQDDRGWNRIAEDFFKFCRSGDFIPA